MKSAILREPNGAGDSLTVVDRSSACGSLPQFLPAVRNTPHGYKVRLCRAMRVQDWNQAKVQNSHSSTGESV